jgi:uncharacterized repeat protein (TIGR04138 family)
MSLRDDLAVVLARDPRYTFPAYLFVFEALEHAKNLKKKAMGRAKRGRSGEQAQTRHVNPRELCEAARDLALRQYGFLALGLLARWGIRSTADLGEIVFNLIASGDLEKTPTDTRADFDAVYNFETAFRADFVHATDEDG